MVASASFVIALSVSHPLKQGWLCAVEHAFFRLQNAGRSLTKKYIWAFNRSCGLTALGILTKRGELSIDLAQSSWYCEHSYWSPGHLCGQADNCHPERIQMNWRHSGGKRSLPTWICLCFSGSIHTPRRLCLAKRMLSDSLWPNGLSIWWALCKPLCTSLNVERARSWKKNTLSKKF